MVFGVLYNADLPNTITSFIAASTFLPDFNLDRPISRIRHPY